jgi:hypothetical protein
LNQAPSIYKQDIANSTKMPVGGRVTGKLGYSNYVDGRTHHLLTFLEQILTKLCLEFPGKSYAGINEEIIYLLVGMSVIIAILILLGLLYIAREKCNKHREYYITV